MLLRASVTDRSSSGWRSISSTLRGNSGSSSRNSTPLCARLTSPGRGVPRAAADQPGVRNGVVRRAERPFRAASPRRAAAGPRRCGSAWSHGLLKRQRRKDARRIVSPAWFCPSRAARSSGRCVPPAAATSSARLAVVWPRTSPKIGAWRSSARSDACRGEPSG